jgi:hypothetical protein
MNAEYLQDLMFMARKEKRHNTQWAQPIERIIAGTSTAQDRHNVAHMVRCERITSEIKGFDASYDIGLEAAILAI